MASELELAKQVIEDKCFHDVTLNRMSQNDLLSCVRDCPPIFHIEDF